MRQPHRSVNVVLPPAFPDDPRYHGGMKLIKAWTGDLDRAYELFGKFQADEHGFVNDAYGLSRDEFAQYMRKVEDMHAGRNLPEGYVPATKYILVNDSGDYVGIFNLRHRLNDRLREGAGHIGYGWPSTASRRRTCP